MDVLSRPLGHVNNLNAIPVHKTDIPHLLKKAHGDAGHQKHVATLNSLRQNFTWPSMAKDVEMYVSACQALVKLLLCKLYNHRPKNWATPFTWI